MGYYIRVLGNKVESIPIEELRKAAQPAVLRVEDDDNGWQQLILAHKSGTEIATIEKNLVLDGQRGSDEIKEFIEEVPHYKPESAVMWLRQYLPTVKVVYAFQLLSGTDIEDGWGTLHRLYSTIWKHAGGILQADSEGFSDEAGFTILWQFDKKVTGSWNVGIFKDGSWLHFQMDLGNEHHREAFWRGEVPNGVDLL